MDIGIFKASKTQTLQQFSMDLQLKQWRSQQIESEEQPSAAKIPKHVFDQIQSQTTTSTVLPLFVPEPTSSKLSSLSQDSSSRFPKMGSFFSWSQWQELELQALIYRYMLVGATVPQELLLPIKKSPLHLSSPSYFLHHPLQHLPHYQPPWYLGKGAMDPEPGRCRRTDGKKWRCSRDVYAGHKYCERHMHRGRNRSRKPVETPTTTMSMATTTTASSFSFGGGGGEEVVGQGQGGSFFFSGSSNSTSELFQLSKSCSEMKQESNKINNKRPYESHNGLSNNRSDEGHILRPFFDDWPRSSLQEADNSSSSMSSSTCLSISMSGNSSSDVSLKLSTGNEEEALNGRDQGNMSWWSGGGSQQHHHQMGGPLAEALRSSSSSSPTSVLHQLGVSTQAFH